MNQDSLAATRSPEAPVLNRRRKSFWEPIYTRENLEPFESFLWNTRNITGISRLTCRADDLKEVRLSRPISVVNNFRFSECDFLGSFDFGNFTFNDCSFELCDLGRSTWRNVKFKKCNFTRCSLTQSTFDSCQFIDCSWSKIGLSGNETNIKECLITNPGEFVLSAYTNLDKEVLENQKNPTNVCYQLMRLEQSKLKVARLLLTSLEHHGDDAGYYEAVKTYLNQSLTAKLAEVTHDIYEKKRPIANRILKTFLKFERLILNASGSINAWGASIARPALVGCAIVVGFAGYYNLFEIQKTVLDGLIASFDITTLVGYTKHASKDSSIFIQLSYMANVLIGLWWYAIFVPTVINRISRVRG